MAKIKKSTKAELDSYLALIREFPLRPIRNDEEHEAATEIISRLINTPMDAGTSDYFDVLVDLVTKYEDEHHTVEYTSTPQTSLRFLMEQNELTQADIGRIIGDQTVVSRFLKGERELSKAHIKALAARFHVDASLFF